MRKNRFIGQDRCYHLVSRLAHRAFFLDDEEKDRAVALMRRVEEFCGVVVLAYAFMSNHFHIFVYVPKAEEIDEAEVMRRIRALYRDASLAQVVATWNRLKTEERELFSRARPTKKYVSRFEAYKASFVRRMWNSSEFMRTFKQHFTMSFNGRREHSGTMFEGRYHERNHPAERPTMWRTSATSTSTHGRRGLRSVRKTTAGAALRLRPVATGRPGPGMPSCTEAAGGKWSGCATRRRCARF